MSNIKKVAFNTNMKYELTNKLVKEICLYGLSFDEQYINEILDENSYIIYEYGLNFINEIPIKLLDIINKNKRTKYNNQIFIKFNQNFFFDDYHKLDKCTYCVSYIRIRTKNNIPINIYFNEKIINSKNTIIPYRQIGNKENIVNDKYKHYITKYINGFIIQSNNGNIIQNIKISFNSIITEKYDLDYFIINNEYDDFNSNGLVRYLKFDLLKEKLSYDLIKGDILLEINNCENLNVDIYPIYDNILIYNSGFVCQKISFN